MCEFDVLYSFICLCTLLYTIYKVQCETYILALSFAFQIFELQIYMYTFVCSDFTQSNMFSGLFVNLLNIFT